MKTSRTILHRIKGTALLAMIAAACACVDLDVSDGDPEALTTDCAEGTELVGQACQPVSAIRIQECPSGAQLAEAGQRQRCQRDASVRHGASSDWYASGRDRVHTEWWEGRKHGKFTLWYENGQVRAEGFHVHGKPAGEWIYYAEDGSVLQRRTFDAAPPPTAWLADAIAGRPPVLEDR
jgi:hypothetical protein